MKYFILILFYSLQLPLCAQQTDDNTLVINNYFQIINDKPIERTESSPNYSAQSYVKLVQVGNENKIYINSLQTGDDQIVNQVGSQNKYNYYNYYSNENSSLNVNQEGTLNSLQVFGENSLMKDATIYQKSDFKSIVIKNYTN